VASDYRVADLSPRERAICDYSVKLTRTPWEMERADLTPMRDEGLTDRDILDVCMIAAYYAYVNRIADGLGVAVEGGDELIGW
jgi:uncharacterized peroxidase-related enzyme